MGAKVTNPSKPSFHHDLKFQPSALPIDVDIGYTSTVAGISELQTAIDIIRKVFPHSKIYIQDCGRTGDLIVKYNRRTIFNKKRGDGNLSRNNVQSFVDKLKKRVVQAQIRNERVYVEQEEEDL